MYTSISRGSDFVMFVDNAKNHSNKINPYTKNISEELEKDKVKNKEELIARIAKEFALLDIKQETKKEEEAKKETAEKEEAQQQDGTTTELTEETDTDLEQETPIETVVTDTPSEEEVFSSANARVLKKEKKSEQMPDRYYVIERSLFKRGCHGDKKQFLVYVKI